MRLGFWAIMDEALFALSSFVVTLVLARSLSAVDFGAFSIAFSMLLLVSGFHNALLTEPMLVLGAEKYLDNQTAYLKCVRGFHWPLCGLLSTGLIVAGCIVYVFGSNTLTLALVSSSIGAPGILFSLLIRRSCYLTTQVKLAAVSSTLYFLFICFGLGFLTTLGLVSSISVFILMSISGTSSAILTLNQLRPAARDQIRKIFWAQFSKDHWRYGRWIIGTTLTSWIVSSLPNVLLGTVIYLGASGALAALNLLIRPILFALPPVAMLITPMLAREKSRRQMKLSLATMLAVVTLMAGIWWLILIFFGQSLLSLLYGDKYVEYARLLIIIGVIPVVSGIASVYTTALRAMVRPDLIFRSTVAAAITTSVIGVPLILLFALQGAVLSSVVSTGLTAAVTAIVVVKPLRNLRE